MFHNCTQHIDTNLKTHHKSVGLQRHSIYSAQVYTFFNKPGWCFCPLYKLWQTLVWKKKKKNVPSHTPKKGFLKLHTRWRLSTQGLLCVKQVHAGLWHKMHNYCHHLTFFQFQLVLFLYSKKNKEVPKLNQCLKSCCRRFVRKAQLWSVITFGECVCVIISQNLQRYH